MDTRFLQNEKKVSSLRTEPTSTSKTNRFGGRPRGAHGCNPGTADGKENEEERLRTDNDDDLSTDKTSQARIPLHPPPHPAASTTTTIYYLAPPPNSPITL